MTDLTATIDTTKFDASLKRYINFLKVNPRKVVEFRCRRLIRSLIRFSWPKDVSRSKARLDKRVKTKFSAMGNQGLVNVPKKGSGDIRWYAANATHIYGVAEDADLRDRDGDALWALWKVMERSFSKSGKSINTGKMHGKQQVVIRRNILVSPKARNDLIRRLKRHVGRLKAGWTVAWEKLTGQMADQIPGLPNWVKEHAGSSRQARGYAVDGLATPGHPQFEIANFAKGVTAVRHGFLSTLQYTLNFEAKAMADDLKFALANPDKWQQREAAAGRDWGTLE